MRLVLSLLLFTTGCAISYPKMSAEEAARIERETHLDDLPSNQAEKLDGVVRVMAHGGMCSGSLVDRSIVLTSAHCVGELDAGDIHIELGRDYLPWGRVGAKTIRTCDDRDVDLAVIVTSKPVPNDVPLFRVRGTGASEGEHITRLGFGGGKAWSMPAAGSMAPIYAMRRESREGTVRWTYSNAIAVEVEADHGDSGGPMIGEDGTLVAITTATIENADQKLVVGTIPSACPSLLGIDRYL
jgi:S1-C subfamily serine protease